MPDTFGGIKTGRREATRANPCPVCRTGSKGCSRQADGLHFCRGADGEVPGFARMGKSKDGVWTLYRAEDDPVLLNGRDHRPPKTRPATNTDWQARAEEYAPNLTPELRQRLAGDLGLPVEALDALPHVGYMDRGPHKHEDVPLGRCSTFPEVDAQGNIIGIVCRYFDVTTGVQNKRSMAGGERGLTVPADWSQGRGPILIAEGASDVLALAHIGLCVVGRPNNRGGVAHLAELLRSQPRDRDVIVMGEYDPKPDGKWPGLEGCKEVASRLSQVLGRDVSWALPPDGKKDARAWVCAQTIGG